MTTPKHKWEHVASEEGAVLLMRYVTGLRIFLRNGVKFTHTEMGATIIHDLTPNDRANIRADISQIYAAVTRFRQNTANKVRKPSEDQFDVEEYANAMRA